MQPHILVIEAFEPVRTLLASSLEKAGYTVTTAPTARDGFEFAVQANPGLIITSRSLPDEDGLLLLQRLRDCSDCPAILITGSLLAEKHVADAVVFKPFKPADLMTVVQQLIPPPVQTVPA